MVEKNGDVTSFADGFDKSNLCGIIEFTRGTNDGLLEAGGYSDVDVSDVSLSNQGLIVSIDEGEKIEGVYYPKGYKLFIK